MTAITNNDIVDSVGTNIQIGDTVAQITGQRSRITLSPAVVIQLDFSNGWVKTSVGTCKVPATRLLVIGRWNDEIDFPQAFMRGLQE